MKKLLSVFMNGYALGEIEYEDPFSPSLNCSVPLPDPRPGIDTILAIVVRDKAERRVWYTHAKISDFTFAYECDHATRNPVGMCTECGDQL